jgi:hypothetical protein
MPETDFSDIKKRIAAQVQKESEHIDELHRSGDIMNGNLIPDEPPPAEDKPKATPPAPTVEDEPTGPIFGKYKTMAEAEQGYSHLLQLAREAQNERDQYKERLAQPQQSPPPPVAQTPTSKAHPSTDFLNQDAVVKLAEDLGVEPRRFAEFAQTLYTQATQAAEARADQRVDERLTPVINQAQAQTQFYSQHPEAQGLQAEIDAYVGGLPEDEKDVIRAMGANGQIKQALNYVYKGFQLQRQTTAQADMKDKSQATEGKRVSQRAAAALPQSSPGTPIHAASDDTPDPQMMAELAERARANDADAQLVLRRLTFGRHLPPQMRTWEQQR